MGAKTPREVAQAVAAHFDGTIETCEIADDMDGWCTVRARVRPRDRRRSPFRISESGSTRAMAVARFIAEAPAWASVNQCVPR